MPDQAEASLLALIESTEDVIWSVGLDYRLVTFNCAFRRTFEVGYGFEPAAGMLPEDLLPPERAAIFPTLYRRALADGPFRTECNMRDGRTLEIAFNPIVVDGKAAGVSVFGKDVTEPKKAEKALREAKRKYREIFDGALEGIFQTSPASRPLTVNPALASMLGYDSPQDLIATVQDLAHDVWVDPEERARCIELIGENRAVRRHECRFKRKDGSIIWVSLNARGAYATDGKTPVVEGFVEDITERKQTLDALREREAQLNESERIALVGSVRWEAATGTFIWSEGFYRIFGLDPKLPAPTGEQRAKLYTPESLARMDASIREIIATGKTEDLKLQIVRQDGEVRWVRARARATCDASGRVTRYIGTLQDITAQKLAHSKLHESEEHYRATFEQAAIGIVHTALDGRIVCCNAHFAQIVGRTIAEVIGLTYQQITAPEDLDASAVAFRRVICGESAHATWEKRYIRKDGAPVWARLTSSIQRDEEGRPVLLETFVENIDARKAGEQRLAKALEELRTGEIRYRTVFQTSLDGIVVSRLDNGQYIDVNQAFLKTMGFERDEVIGHTSEELGMWTDVKIRQGIVELLHRDSSFRSLTIPYRKKNGDVFWMQLSASVIHINGVECIVSITRDISEIRAAEERIKDLAFFDQLTHLPNRRLLLERLEVPSIANAGDSHEKALLFLDLDNFKKLNDIAGPDVGDLLLQEVARRLTACVRGADTVARCGGDEFGVLLEGLGSAPEPAATQAQFVAAKIASAVGQPYSLAGREYHCNCSIGITIFGGATKSAHEVLRQAELALHQSKIDGRNAMRFFAPDLQAAFTARGAVEDDLRRAVRDNQFLLYYQPQVDSTGLIGAEALIRWDHPVRGLLAPAAFIPLAEETGLILPMGEWVLEAACAQLTQWDRRSDAARIILSVNISAHQFCQPEFVEQVMAVVYKSGANPENLRLELTESILLNDVDSAIAKMTALKERGVRFSIDDFGTGYSSLTYLKRLPIDQLKIDRSFVWDILADETSGAIAQAIVSLSHALGLSVIAEGVETEEQREYLANLGCGAFQGFLFSRPLPIEEFERGWIGQINSPSSLFLTPRLS
jgi:diguanylate cyclase (GGDEF)-like protein/PAS domain S-box-containing protein